MSQNLTLLSLPPELRLAICDYLVPTEIYVFRGDKTHDILLLDSFVARTLHSLLGSCRLMRRETLGVVGNSNIVITGLETFSRPQQACDIVTALATWASVGGAGNAIWQVARKITIFAGTPLRDGLDATSHDLSAPIEEPVLLFPFMEFSKILRQSNVATGKLQLRIKTVAVRPGLPAFTDITTGNLAEAMTGCSGWVDATKLRLEKWLEDPAYARRFGGYETFLPYSVQGLCSIYKFVAKLKELDRQPVKLERKGNNKGMKRMLQICTA
ncbi:hypothetical protein KC343_g8232 [Hortaea werneckii]|nr:hypothetical protein KC352_g23149 [Hortaea werneckii]KAI7567099.1 hypothetical protein KC317_g5216 [Hortaea werneckii]KAI7618443.1 hypothetical protein KC346_g5006 [Hortaea werneckii]KAI7620870.1 hypothetical protein KC343_g8232 [Hortaea werneckii]KAI7666058.1 hypothetical protein KC319_g7039 [Hortaea werneckii]